MIHLVFMFYFYFVIRQVVPKHTCTSEYDLWKFGPLFLFCRHSRHTDQSVCWPFSLVISQVLESIYGKRAQVITICSICKQTQNFYLGPTLIPKAKPVFISRRYTLPITQIRNYKFA